MSIPKDNNLHTENKLQWTKTSTKQERNAATMLLQYAFLKVMFTYTTRTECEPIAKYVHKEEARNNFFDMGIP